MLAGGRRRCSQQSHSVNTTASAAAILKSERCCNLAHAVLAINHHGCCENAAHVGNFVKVVLEVDEDAGLGRA